jgi:hypothetical protein
MPTRAQDARARRIGNDALATAAAAVEHGQAWRDAVESLGSASDEDERWACRVKGEEEATLMDEQVASLTQIGLKRGLITQSARDFFAADHPELDAAFKGLEAAAKAARDVSVKRGVQPESWGSKPEHWAWLDELERASAALGEVLERRPTEGKTARDLVTLAQAAGMVHRAKRTLEHYKSTGMPLPTVEGGGGRPDLWDWEVIRPWLEAEFGINLPETFPAGRRS